MRITVAVLFRIKYQNLAVATAKNNRRIQPGRAAANNYAIINFHIAIVANRMLRLVPTIFRLLIETGLEPGFIPAFRLKLLFYK